MIQTSDLMGAPVQHNVWYRHLHILGREMPVTRADDREFEPMSGDFYTDLEAAITEAVENAI